MIPTPTYIDVNADGMTDEERAVAQNLGERIERGRPYLQTRENYYNGEQEIEQLGIAIPEQLRALHSATGWPRIAVDALDEKLDVEGFRFPGSTDADQDLWDIWTANQMDQESGLGHLDALVFGKAFGIAGTGPCGPGGDCPPLLTVESPVNMAVNFDATSRAVIDGLQVYEMDGTAVAALLRPEVTIHLYEDVRGGPWKVFQRDEHNMGITPVVMLANRARLEDRYGRSEITPEIMSITDAACRTLLGMEVAREFFGAPQRYILGAAEEAFQKADGSSTSAWQTYIGRVLALERDENGELPVVGTFSSGDPTVFSNIFQTYARIMASLTGLPPHMLGFASDNPASAEGIRAAEARLDKRSLRRQRAFEGGWRDLMKLALMIKNNGELPADAHKIDVLWADPATPTPVATTQAVLAQVQMGYLPAESDVTGEKLGFSAVERARIEADRQRSAGRDALSQIADAVRGSAQQPPAA